jgi:hypothetical protein
MRTASGPPLDVLRRTLAPWGKPSGLIRWHHFRALTFTESEAVAEGCLVRVVQIDALMSRQWVG